MTSSATTPTNSRTISQSELASFYRQVTLKGPDGKDYTFTVDLPTYRSLTEENDLALAETVLRNYSEAYTPNAAITELEPGEVSYQTPGTSGVTSHPAEDGAVPDEDDLDLEVIEGANESAANGEYIVWSFKRGKTSAKKEKDFEAAEHLLELYQKYVEQFNGREQKNTTLWQVLADLMATNGYPGLTGDSVKIKFGNLKRPYTNYVQNIDSTGRGAT